MAVPVRAIAGEIFANWDRQKISADGIFYCAAIADTAVNVTRDIRPAPRPLLRLWRKSPNQIS
jgi:hypothetical protein